MNDLETSLATLFEYDEVTYKVALAALPPEPGKNDAVISDPTICVPRWKLSSRGG